MKIILLETVDTLGRRGATVDVKQGFARNYLIPRKIGLPATPGNIKQLETLQQRFIQEEEERLGGLREMASKMNELSLTIEVKASTEGHLYGSVNTPVIREALKGEGYELEERTIKLDAPIKSLGVYSVPIALHPEIGCEIKVWVVEEKVEGAEATVEEAPASQDGGEGEEKAD